MSTKHVCCYCGVVYDENPTLEYDAFDGIDETTGNKCIDLQCACDCGAVFPMDHRLNCGGILCESRAMGVPVELVPSLLRSIADLEQEIYSAEA